MPLSTLPNLSASLLEWAQWYAAQGWPVIPMHTPMPGGGCSCQHGPTCQHPGKHPRTLHGRNDASTHSQTVADWWQRWPDANIAIRTDALVVIDTDPRHDGPNNIRKLEAQYGALPDCPRVISGSGGDHYYFSVPSDGIALLTQDGLIAPGIDIKGFGGNINVPPSLHPSGQRYSWDGRFSLDAYPLSPPPDWLVTLARAARPAQSHSYEAGVSIPEGSRYTYLIGVAARARYNGFSEAQIYGALEIANQNCQPPEDEKELRKYAQWAARKAMAEPEVLTPATLSVPPPVGWPGGASSNGTTSHAVPSSPLLTAWTKDLFAYKNGELKQNAFNIGQTLRYHPYWHMPERKLWYDVIRGRSMCGNEQISKHLATAATSWFGGEMRLGISNLDLLKTCMEAQALQCERDLLKEHLANLPEWDHEPRLESWLSDVSEAPDDPYTREISRRLPVSMVARALFPGCQYREVVILEGKENAGKSHLVETLATSEWYVTMAMNMESKDAHIMLHQFWMAELAELDAISRTEDSRMKAFVTMQVDTYVPKYSNVSISIPRRTVFIGTTNDTGAYLKGQTGNTRYLPLWIGKRVDRERLERIRNQVLAEAMAHYYARLEDWWAMEAEIEERAQEEREKRRERPVYEDPLNDWLEVGRADEKIWVDGHAIKLDYRQDETSWAEIAKWYLKLDTPERWKDRSLQMQIAATLKSLGWIQDTVYRNGHQARIWKHNEERS